MYILDFHKLEEGDILLTAQKAMVSKTVRLISNSDFSHAILHVGEGSYIHSDGDGVHSGNIQRLVFEKPEHVIILRPKQHAQIQKSVTFARLQIGKQYSVKDAINTKNPLSKKKEKNRQFCSRLVAQAYAFAGLNLVDNSSYCTPQDIRESEYLYVIANVLKKASKEEVAFANSYNPLKKQTDITNEILIKARKLTGYDLQTLEELSSYIISNKKHDKDVVKIFKNSGYLSMWEHEMLENPWRYDGNIFISLPISNKEKRERAIFEIDSAKKQLKLYSQNYLAYQELSMQGMLDFIKMEMQLYKNLINQMNQRLEAANFVLKNT